MDMITKVRLAVYKNKKLDLAVPITDVTTTIGRDNGNSVQLPDEKVSKFHAVIRAKDGQLTIEDLESTNGTLVNGEGIKSAQLANGDRISIGPFELIFETSVTGAWVPAFILEESSRTACETVMQAPKQPPATPGG